MWDTKIRTHKKTGKIKIMYILIIMYLSNGRKEIQDLTLPTSYQHNMKIFD